jgi:hypothetical protein
MTLANPNFFMMISLLLWFSVAWGRFSGRSDT